MWHFRFKFSGWWWWRGLSGRRWVALIDEWKEMVIFWLMLHRWCGWRMIVNNVIVVKVIVVVVVV